MSSEPTPIDQPEPDVEDDEWEDPYLTEEREEAERLEALATQAEAEPTLDYFENPFRKPKELIGAYVEEQGFNVPLI